MNKFKSSILKLLLVVSIIISQSNFVPLFAYTNGGKGFVDGEVLTESEESDGNLEYETEARNALMNVTSVTHSLSPVSGGANHGTSINGAFGRDALYLGETSTHYRVYISGYEGLVAKEGATGSVTVAINGTNATLQFAFAIHESGRGLSNIARHNNNLFGINAVDSNPAGSANAFETVQAGIGYLSNANLIIVGGTNGSTPVPIPPDAILPDNGNENTNNGNGSDNEDDTPTGGTREGETTERVNFRTGPGTSYSIIKTLPVGQSVTILSESNGWLKVRVGTQEGWVSSQYVK